jgi:hypothetical protein
MTCESVKEIRRKQQQSLDNGLREGSLDGAWFTEKLVMPGMPQYARKAKIDGAYPVAEQVPIEIYKAVYDHENDWP